MWAVKAAAQKHRRYAEMKPQQRAITTTVPLLLDA